MALLGPMVVVAETSAADVVDVLGKAGAFPIVEIKFANAAAAVAEIQPAALMIADPAPKPPSCQLQALVKAIETRGGPFMPVLARADGAHMVAIPFAVPIAIGEPASRSPRSARPRATSRTRSYGGVQKNFPARVAEVRAKLRPGLR